MSRFGRALCGAIAAVAATVSAAPANTALPLELRDVGIDQKLDQSLPLDLTFRDENGETIRLGSLFGSKPVVLQFAYFHCPMLCPMALEGLVRSLRPLAWNAGEEFQIVTVSIDARETPALAAAAKRKVVDDYGRNRGAESWRFLVGEPDSVVRLTQAAGFRYRYDAAKDQFAHGAGLFIVTPKGRISRVLYGVDYMPRDLRLALVEASENKIGTLADQILLFCYHYDPATGKYGAAAMTAVRVGGLLTLFALAAFVVVELRQERRA
jgi:protein SCO1/2